MSHRDHGGLRDRRVAHQTVLERDRTDPLATGLDEILRSILNLHRAALVDRRDVAGLEPAVGREPIGAIILEVTGCHPRSPDLELAHRLSVPWDQALDLGRANLDERRGPALL